ncbi:MAG TPA: 4-alpha-glucanotransferase [Pyrinomonadaceae bacterium]|nr:4-alpha-glucanotransferase [Pyrinomonadaceae bacterium]
MIFCESIKRYPAPSHLVPEPFWHRRSRTGAYKFIDFLVEAGQTLWQVLPLGPTGYGDSPYASYSAFAGNTLLISPERLVDEGLLDHGDLEETPVGPVDYGWAHQLKDKILASAY